MSRSWSNWGYTEWVIDNVMKDKLIGQIREQRVYTNGASEYTPFRNMYAKAYRTEVIARHQPWAGEGVDLLRFIMDDGNIYETFVQAEPWASGPHTFLAVKRPDGSVIEESLWTAEAMAEYTGIEPEPEIVYSLD